MAGESLASQTGLKSWERGRGDPRSFLAPEGDPHVPHFVSAFFQAGARGASKTLFLSTQPLHCGGPH